MTDDYDPMDDPWFVSRHRATMTILSPQQRRTLWALASQAGDRTAAQLAKLTGSPVTSLRAVLSRLRRLGHLRREGRGRYDFADSGLKVYLRLALGLREAPGSKEERQKIDSARALHDALGHPEL